MKDCIQMRIMNWQKFAKDIIPNFSKDSGNLKNYFEHFLSYLSFILIKFVANTTVENDQIAEIQYDKFNVIFLSQFRPTHGNATRCCRLQKEILT